MNETVEIIAALPAWVILLLTLLWSVNIAAEFVAIYYRWQLRKIREGRHNRSIF